MAVHESELLFPFESEKSFVDNMAASADLVFGAFSAKPDVRKADLKDAYQLWVGEVYRWSREIKPRNRSSSAPERERDAQIPSNLKKAGALAAAINRCKPIKFVQPVLTYDHFEPTEMEKVALVFQNEFFAFEVARGMILEAEEVRDDMAPLSRFLEAIGQNSESIFTPGFIFDFCYFLKSRSPSATSLHMLFEAYFSIMHMWRRANKAC